MRGWLHAGLGFAAGIAVALFVEPRPMGRADRSPQAELAELRVRTREMEAELEQLRAAAAGPLPAEAMAPPAEATVPAAAPPEPPAEIPAAVLDAGAALRVPDEALRAAFDAFRKPSPENDARLKQHGADGFRALVALLRGGLSGKTTDRLFELSWKPGMAGQERALIETADSEVHPWSRWSALTALGFTDTPMARDYVVGRLRGETDAGFFMCAAEAAGRLRESRAVPDLFRGVRNKNWSSPLRGTVLHAAVQASGDGARAFLVDYLHEPNSDLLAGALGHLHRIDPKAAREEAAALLAGPRADSLTGDELADIRMFTK